MGIGTCGWSRGSQRQQGRWENNTMDCFTPPGMLWTPWRRHLQTAFLASVRMGTWVHHNLILKERDCHCHLLANETSGYLGYVHTQLQTHPGKQSATITTQTCILNYFLRTVAQEKKPVIMHLSLKDVEPDSNSPSQLFPALLPLCLPSEQLQSGKGGAAIIENQICPFHLYRLQRLRRGGRRF